MGWVHFEVVKVVGSATGLAGVALALILRRYERPIREKFFHEMQPHQAYTQVRMITGAVWIAAAIGLSLWLFAVTMAPS